MYKKHKKKYYLKNDKEKMNMKGGMGRNDDDMEIVENDDDTSISELSFKSTPELESELEINKKMNSGIKLSPKEVEIIQNVPNKTESQIKYLEINDTIINIKTKIENNEKLNDTDYEFIDEPKNFHYNTIQKVYPSIKIKKTKINQKFYFIDPYPKILDLNLLYENIEPFSEEKIIQMNNFM